MAERARPTFDGQAVAKALGTEASPVTDPAYGDGQHFQVRSDKTFLSLDTFPESGVSRITTKGARIELFGGSLPTVEEEGVVFLRKDAQQEHSSVVLHPDGGVTVGYMVDTGPAPIAGLPDDAEDTEQIIQEHEAAQAKPAQQTTEGVSPVLTPAQTPPEDPVPAVVTVAEKPPQQEQSDEGRTPGAFPDVRPMIQRVSSDVPLAVTSGQGEPVSPEGQAQEAGQDEGSGTSAQEKDQGTRVKLIGRLGRTPTFRTTASDKLVGKFPLAVHLESGETQWHDVLVFGARAEALQKRAEAQELVKGNEVEVVGYAHEREYQAKDGTMKKAQEINSVAVKRR